MIGWGVVWEGFKSDHFREGRDCGWGELQLEVLLENVTEGAYEVNVSVSVKAFHEYVGA